MTTTGIATRICLASKFLAHGQPSWIEGSVGHRLHVSLWHLVDLDRSKNFWRGVEVEKNTHRERAAAHATQKLGACDPTDVMSTSDESEAWRILHNAEYDRLESASRERRLLALAECLRAGDLEYTPCED